MLSETFGVCFSFLDKIFGSLTREEGQNAANNDCAIHADFQGFDFLPLLH